MACARLSGMKVHHNCALAVVQLDGLGALHEVEQASVRAPRRVLAAERISARAVKILCVAAEVACLVKCCPACAHVGTKCPRRKDGKCALVLPVVLARSAWRRNAAQIGGARSPRAYHSHGPRRARKTSAGGIAHLGSAKRCRVKRVDHRRVRPFLDAAGSPRSHEARAWY